MRRVHNDNGSSTQAASPPPSGQTSSSRGRKRKNDVQEKSSTQEKTSSRKSSKAAAEAAKAAELQSNAEWEAWYEHQKALQSLVVGYTQPDDPQTLQYIKDAQDHLTAMGRISNDLVGSSKDVYRRGCYKG